MKIGDKVKVVKIVETDDGCGWDEDMNETIGMDGVIEDYDTNDHSYWVELTNNDSWWYEEGSLEVVNDEATVAFKEGDEVRIVRKVDKGGAYWADSMDGTVGETGVIREIEEKTEGEVQRYRIGSKSWMYAEGSLELVNDEATVAFKEGDEVRIIMKSTKGGWVVVMDETIGEVGVVKAVVDQDSEPRYLLKPQGWYYQKESLELVKEKKSELNADLSFLEAMRNVKEGRKVLFENDLGLICGIDKDTELTQTVGFYIRQKYELQDDHIRSLDELEDMHEAIFCGTEVTKDEEDEWLDEEGDAIDESYTISCILDISSWRKR